MGRRKNASGKTDLSSALDRARQQIATPVPGQTLLRVNYAALEQKTPLYPDAMFYLKSGWYRDYPFHCVDCHKLEVWTAAQQKWWYEVAKGGKLTVATRCRRCRRIHREQQSVQRAKSRPDLLPKIPPDRSADRLSTIISDLTITRPYRSAHETRDRRAFHPFWSGPSRVAV
jgi:hypothetical protein